MAYRGPERRRNKVFVTRNTEYHVRDGVCVAVRDRTSSTWRPGHMALRRAIGGVVKFHANGAVVPFPGEPAVGDAIYFEVVDRGGYDNEIVTSRVERIDRPERRIVASYPG